MYKVVILDDDVTDLKIYEEEINSFFKEKAIAFQLTKFESPLNFLASVKETKVDLVFLDIDMPEKNGIEVGQELISIYPNINIIFLSSREDLVFDCFALHPFGFIRKAKFKQDFISVMEQFNESVLSSESDDERIDFIKKNNVTSYKLNEIMYIEGFRNYQELHLKNGSTDLVRVSMNELETELSKKGFLRTQKGFLVNYLFIRSISSSDVILVDGSLVPLSKKRRDEILETYLNISRDKNLMMNI